MEVIIEKIHKIQNKKQSLRWGHYITSENEVMFAVGNTAYPKEPHFFIVTSDYCIYLVNNDHKKILQTACADIAETTSAVITLLKEWFPAK